MSTVTPPEGYRIVRCEEIETVPKGALYRLDGSGSWVPSVMIGDTPAPSSTYAIPIIKDEVQGGEPYAEMRAEIEAARKHIERQDKEATCAAGELVELRGRIKASDNCISKQAKIIDALLQIIRE